MIDPKPFDILDSEPFTVLFVCTANICRSPMAENMFRVALNERLGRTAGWEWIVRSGGTHALKGSSMHELAREALIERRIPVEGAPAEQVTIPGIESADLVLTAGRAQRAWIVERSPSSVRRVFTLRHFARLCVAGRESRPDLVVERGAQLLELAGAGRSRLQPVGEDQDVIADPIGGDIVDFRRCADLITTCIDGVLGTQRA